MGTDNNSISSQGFFDGLARLESALSQLEEMSVAVELDRVYTDSDKSHEGRHTSGGRDERRRKSEKTHTIAVNKEPGFLGFGHATISIDDDTAVGLEPNSDFTAGVGFGEDLAEAAAVGMFSDLGTETPMPNYVPAHIEEDLRIPQRQAVIHATARQAAEARAFIWQAEHNPQIYDLLYANCAQWVEEVLAAIGIDMPSEETPDDLVDYLKQKYPQWR